MKVPSQKGPHPQPGPVPFHFRHSCRCRYHDYSAASCQCHRHVAHFQDGAYLIGDRDDHPFPVGGNGSQREHVRQDGVTFLLAEFKIPAAVFRRRFRMIEHLPFPGRRLLAEVIRTKIMQKPRPCRCSRIASQSSRYLPGEVGNIEAVQEPVAPLMMAILAQRQEFLISEYLPHLIQVLFGDLR